MRGRARSKSPWSGPVTVLPRMGDPMRLFMRAAPDNSIWEPALWFGEEEILEIDAIVPDEQPAGGGMAAREVLQSGQGIATPAALDLDGNQPAALAHDEVHLTVGLAPWLDNYLSMSR